MDHVLRLHSAFSVTHISLRVFIRETGKLKCHASKVLRAGNIPAAETLQHQCCRDASTSMGSTSHTRLQMNTPFTNSPYPRIHISMAASSSRELMPFSVPQLATLSANHDPTTRSNHVKSLKRSLTDHLLAVHGLHTHHCTALPM